MEPLRCDFCNGNLVMDSSREFAVCEFCGTKYLRDVIQQKIQEVTGTVSVEGDVHTKEADFVIRGGVLEKYNGESTEVVIPDTVTTIGESAFQNLSITKVVIPESVTEIRYGAFSGTRLETVDLSKNLKEIPDHAFFKTPLKQIVIPSSVTKIGDYAFSETLLKEIVIPASVTIIGDRAFEKCPELETVYFMPGCNILVEGYAFLECGKLRKVVAPAQGKLSGRFSWSRCELLTEIENPEVVDKGEVVFGDSPIGEQFQSAAWRKEGKCQYCGNSFERTLLGKKCCRCGKRKDY